MLYSCPYCHEMIYIEECDMNCRLFCHALYKNSYQQVNPHISIDEINNLINNNLIIGCGKTFTININNEITEINNEINKNG